MTRGAAKPRRERPVTRIVNTLRSPMVLALAASLAWITLYNRRFWTETLHVLQPFSATDAGFLVSLFALLWAVHALLLALAPGRAMLKGLSALLFVAAAIGAYFADTYGVSIDREAIRNLMETDTREALGLFNARFVFYSCVLGLAPAAVVLYARLEPAGTRRALLQRGALLIAAVLVALASVTLLGARYASFIREHKSVRFLVTPANIVYGFSSYASSAGFSPGDVSPTDLESPVKRWAPASARPLVLFLVIGETARSENFQLGGYARATNPELMRRSVDFFGNVQSCGTSTAVSLPCMFSGLGRAAFDGARFRRGTNLLDALSSAGFRVQWRDNNSGCKGICARIEALDYTTRDDKKLCGRWGCFDEIMLQGLAEELARTPYDTVIVFHEAGSHGPAYSERYPKRFEVFKPVCYGNELSRCAVQEVVNAYDNSILYTDYNLAKQIDILKSASKKIDGVLIYVSDHGESLGENGLYLHGAPYLFAPAQQTRVPMIVWMSASYRKRFGIAESCVEAKKDRRFSHDNLYHTALGALGVTTARYNAALDVLADCRSSE